MSETTPTITIREVGSNPPDDSANRVQRIDLSKGVVPLWRRIWRDEPKEKRLPPAPRLAPADELKQKRELLAHLETQLKMIDSRTEGKLPAQTVPIQAVGDVAKRYGAMLNELRDLASESSTDLAILFGILRQPDGCDLINATGARIQQLESQLRPPAKQSEDHARLIAEDESAFRKWGKARQALRQFEMKHVPIPLRHEYKRPRVFGPSFGCPSQNDLQRVADFAAHYAE